MSTTTTKPKHRARDTEVAPKEQPKDQPKPILGVDIKGELQDIPIDLISDPAGVPDRLARVGDSSAIEQLANSMRECGQLQPVMVERITTVEPTTYVRVFGRRRLAAARLLGWKTVRAVVVPMLSPDVRRTVVAIENVQRQNLTPAEETLAVQELMELQAFPAAVQLGKPIADSYDEYLEARHPRHQRANEQKIVTPELVKSLLNRFPPNSQNVVDVRRAVLTDHRVRAIASELVAAMLGKPASWVRDRMYIGRLSEKARALVLAEKLPLAHAREIAKVADEKLRDQLARDYAAGGNDSISDTEPGKLEDLQDEVRKQVFALHVVPWNLQVPFAGKPACAGCPHNSSTQPGLFEHGGDVSTAMVGGRGTWQSAQADSAKVQDAGVCTLAGCYAEKLRAAKGAITAAAKRIVDSDPKKPKKGAVAQAAANVSTKVPAFVDRKALAKKVEDRRDAKRSTGSLLRPSIDSAASKRAEAKRQAEGKWRNAMGERAEDFEERLLDRVKSIRGGWAMLKLLTETKVYDQTHSQQDKAVARAIANPVLAAAIKAAANPSLDSLVFLEQQVSYRGELLDTWNDKDSGILELLASAYGVKLDPAPTLESFMPKDAVETPAAKAATKPAIKTHAAKPAKRLKREPDQVVSDIDRGGDE